MMPRRRLILLLGLILTIFAGLASRAYSQALPEPLRKETGDALWATAAYFGVALLVPWWPRGWVLIGAIVISFGVEFSQLYHAPWIDSLRGYRVGHWLLGNGFHGPDLIAYFIGAGLGWLVDFSAPRRTRRSNQCRADMNGAGTARQK